MPLGRRRRRPVPSAGCALRRAARPAPSPARGDRPPARRRGTGRSTAGATRADSRRRRGRRPRSRRRSRAGSASRWLSVGASRAPDRRSSASLSSAVTTSLSLNGMPRCFSSLPTRVARLAGGGGDVERDRILGRGLAQLERQLGLGRRRLRDRGLVAERHHLAFAGARLAVGVGDLAVGADDLELGLAGQGEQRESERQGSARNGGRVEAGARVHAVSGKRKRKAILADGNTRFKRASRSQRHGTSSPQRPPGRPIRRYWRAASRSSSGRPRPAPA